MNAYRIFQIEIEESLRAEANRLGREDAAKRYPKYAAYLEVMWSGGSEHFEPQMFKHYRQVGTIWADDLEEVFATGNGYPSNVNSCATWTERYHSLSVGDIVETGGKWYMVDPVGFSRIISPLAAAMGLIDAAALIYPAA
jgi:hypothetical protein